MISFFICRVGRKASTHFYSLWSEGDTGELNHRARSGNNPFDISRVECEQRRKSERDLNLFGSLAVLLLEARDLGTARRGEVLGPLIKASTSQKLVELLGVGHQGRREDPEDSSVNVVALRAVRLLAAFIELHVQRRVEDGGDQFTSALSDSHLGEDRLVGTLGTVVQDAVGHIVDRVDHLGHIDTEDAIVGVLDVVNHEFGVDRGLLLTRLLIENEDKAWEIKRGRMGKQMKWLAAVVN